jgi:hypothetical protein
VRKINQNHEDDLVRGLAAEKKRLPKVLRAETKTRSLMFKESLRISMQVSSEFFEQFARTRLNAPQLSVTRCQKPEVIVLNIITSYDLIHFL